MLLSRHGLTVPLINSPDMIIYTRSAKYCRGGAQEDLLLQKDLKDSSLLLSRGIYEAPTLL